MSNANTALKGKKEQMRQMFNRIAESYDRLNHIMSLNIDRAWRRHGVDLVAEHTPHRILDLATGTADLAIYMARRIPSAEVVGVDLSTEMLAVGSAKIEAEELADRVTLQEGDAEALPFADGSFDAVTVAFGVRNFADLPLSLRQMHRVLRQEGMVMIIELSTPSNPVVKWGYEFYAFRLLPWIGGVVSKDRAAYRYLPASIRAFHRPERVVEMMREAGFKEVVSESKSLGIAHVYYAKKKIKG